MSLGREAEQALIHGEQGTADPIPGEADTTRSESGPAPAAPERTSGKVVTKPGALKPKAAHAAPIEEQAVADPASPGAP